MTYRKAIPQATERPSISQPKIKENFTEISDQFGIDHTALEETTRQGKHKKVTLYEQTADPTTVADEVAVYSKEGANGTEIYYRQENNGEVIKLSALKVLAMASVDQNGSLINDRFNVASCTRTLLPGVVQQYHVTYTTPIVGNYMVIVTAANGQSGVGMFYVSGKTNTFVNVVFRDVDGQNTRSGFDLLVYKV